MVVRCSNQSKAYRAYNNRTNVIEQSVHVVFDKNNDEFISSTLFQDLKLSGHTDDKEERVKHNKFMT